MRNSLFQVPNPANFPLTKYQSVVLSNPQSVISAFVEYNLCFPGPTFLYSMMHTLINFWFNVLNTLILWICRFCMKTIIWAYSFLLPLSVRFFSAQLFDDLGSKFFQQIFRIYSSNHHAWSVRIHICTIKLRSLPW